MDDDTRSVSVLVRSGNLGDRLTKIVAALDDQSLPYSRYQTIFLDPGSSDGTSKRLRNLVERRPNVAVHAAEDLDWRSAIESATGDFVLCLGSDDLLFADSLAALLAAAAGGHEIALAESVDGGPVGFVPETVAGVTSVDPAGADAAVAVLAPFALVKRDLLLESLPTDRGAAAIRRTRVKLLRSANSIGVCATPAGRGSGPSHGESAEDIWADAAEALELLGDGEQAARFIAAHATATLDRAGDANLEPALGDRIVDLVQRHWKDRDPSVLPAVQGDTVAALAERDLSAAAAVARPSLEVASTSAEWSAGVLKLAVEGSISALPGAAVDVCRVEASVRNAETAVRYDLETECSVDRSVDGTPRFIARCGLDIALAAAGAPLSDGIWQVVVRLTGSGSTQPIESEVPFQRVTGAVVDGTPVSTFQTNGQLRLDVGARRHGFLGVPYNPAQGVISETVRGALLTITDPDLAVRCEASIPSALYLNRFRLPAVLRVSELGASIECYVSGLAGVSKLDVEVGPAIRESLGLQLRIGAAGDMAIESAVPNKPPTDAAKKAAKKPGKKRSGAKKRSGRVVNRLPESLRPAARAAARSPLVQRVYRKIVRPR